MAACQICWEVWDDKKLNGAQRSDYTLWHKYVDKLYEISIGVMT